MENLNQNWLDVQYEAIEGIRSAILLTVDPIQKSFRTTARCPIDSKESAELIPIAQIALKQRHRTINSGVKETELNDSCFDYLALPIVLNDQLIAVVAVKMIHGSEEEQNQVANTLEASSKSLALSGTANKPPEDFYPEVVRLIAASLEQDTYQAALTALIAQLSTSIGYERASIGILKRHRIQVIALSNNAQFDPRSQLIQAISNVMEEAIDQDSIIVYPPNDTSNFNIHRAHLELSRRFGTGSICTIPLTHDGLIYGALALERSEENPFALETVRLCEQAMALVAPVLELKRQEDQWLITKVFESGKTFASGLFGLKHLGLKLAAILVATTITLASVFDGDFRVNADAVLEGKIQRDIAAPIEGYIETALFRAGDTVSKGDILATLDDKDLKLEHLKLSSQRKQLLREYREAMAEGNRVKVRVLNAQTEQTNAKIELINEQLLRTEIIAPFDGIIIEGDLSQSLGSPVERGDRLFKIAPLEGYRTVLNVDERLISYVTKGKSGHLALASMPGKLLPFVVEKITVVANTEQGHNAFRVEADLQDTPAVLRPGMEGVGKIDAGRAKLIWIWTHELVDWLRLWLWAWWP